jgi:hypothetical protein
MLRVLLFMALLFRTEICVAENVPELRRAFEAIEAQDWTAKIKRAAGRGFGAVALSAPR